MGIDAARIHQLQANVQTNMNEIAYEKEEGKEKIMGTDKERIDSYQQKMATGKYDAKAGVIPFHAVDNTLEFFHIKKEE